MWFQIYSKDDSACHTCKMTSQPKLIKIRADGGHNVIRFGQDLINEMSTARQIASQITDFLEQFFCERNFDSITAGSSEPRVILDMSNIHFISSVGLNELISVNRQARIRGVQLVLADVNESVRNILALTRLERLFQFSYEADIQDYGEALSESSTTRASG